MPPASAPPPQTPRARAALTGTAAIGGDTDAPRLRLMIEIVDIGEAASGKERRPDVAYGSFDATFLVTSSYRNRTRLITVMSSKRQQAWMEADGVTVTFQHGAA